jgi:SAM-dependent methyltransferase
LTDMMTGFKFFKVEVVRHMRLYADGFGIEAEITAEVFKNRWRVYEVPISYSGRTNSEGKKIRSSDFFRVVYWLFKAKLRSTDLRTDTLLRVKLMNNYTRWIYEKINPYLGKKILEIGSGIGTISRYLISKDRTVFLSDINDDYLRSLKNTFISSPFVQIIRSDITSELQGIGKVDSVICVNVLEHIERDAEALSHMGNVLAENGVLLLLVPAHKILFSDFDKSIGHFRRYSSQDLEKKVESAGFKIEKKEYINFLGAIGWFTRYKMFRSRRMPSTQLKILDTIIPFLAFIERYIKFPFGLSLFVVARKK